MARRTRLLRLATTSPNDTSALAAAIDSGEVDPAAIVAIIGKTEGNGCVNDFTRGYSTLALKLLLAERLHCPLADIERRVAIVMSGGTEGGLSPHLLVFSRDEVPASAATPSRLAIGIGLTRPFKPEEIGRAAQIEETAATVQQQRNRTLGLHETFRDLVVSRIANSKKSPASDRGELNGFPRILTPTRAVRAARIALPWAAVTNTERRSRCGGLRNDPPAIRRAVLTGDSRWPSNRQRRSRQRQAPIGPTPEETSSLSSS